MEYVLTTMSFAFDVSYRLNPLIHTHKRYDPILPILEIHMVFIGIYVQHRYFSKPVFLVWYRLTSSECVHHSLATHLSLRDDSRRFRISMFHCFSGKFNPGSRCDPLIIIHFQDLIHGIRIGSIFQMIIITLVMNLSDRAQDSPFIPAPFDHHPGLLTARFI